MAQPLAPNDRRISRRRYEAWVGEPIAPGRSRMIAEGRFASIEDAREWVEETHPDAPVVNFTYYSETDGWQAHAIGTIR